MNEKTDKWASDVRAVMPVDDAATIAVVQGAPSCDLGVDAKHGSAKHQRPNAPDAIKAKTDVRPRGDAPIGPACAMTSRQAIKPRIAGPPLSFLSWHDFFSLTAASTWQYEVSLTAQGGTHADFCLREERGGSRAQGAEEVGLRQANWLCAPKWTPSIVASPTEVTVRPASQGEAASKASFLRLVIMSGPTEISELASASRALAAVAADLFD